MFGTDRLMYSQLQTDVKQDSINVAHNESKQVTDFVAFDDMALRAEDDLFMTPRMSKLDDASFGNSPYEIQLDYDQPSFTLLKTSAKNVPDVDVMF